MIRAVVPLTALLAIRVVSTAAYSWTNPWPDVGSSRRFLAAGGASLMQQAPLGRAMEDIEPQLRPNRSLNVSVRLTNE